MGDVEGVLLAAACLPHHRHRLELRTVHSGIESGTPQQMRILGQVGLPSTNRQDLPS